MSIDKLLKPRYKVIADWPGNNFYDIDEIIIMQVKSNGSYWNGEGSCYLTQEQMDKLPHLFRKLHWWEDRKAQDMPKYVRINLPNHSFNGEIEKIEGDMFFMFWPYTNDCLPATEADYQAYINGVNK